MKLTNDDIEKRLSALPEWTFSHGKLHREYKFPNFSYAIGFIAAAAPSIEKMDHHPEWANVYNRVTVDLVSHDEGGVTERDFRLAGALEAIAQKLI